MKGKTYVLKNVDSGQFSFGSQDQGMMIVEGLNASGVHDIDFSGMLRVGATVHFQQMQTGTIDATGVLESKAAIPGNVNVKTLMTFDPNDLV